MRLERTESEMIVLEEAINRNIPVLGICGGMQLINVFFGGSLYQDINSQLPKALNHENGSEHEISIEDDTILKRIIHAERFAAKSHHHQSVKVLGKGLRVNAKSSDGIIEGIEAPRSFILGIQWHPEVDEGEISDRIFRAFIEECRR
jgi:putative glutamine amidotransferase